MSLSSAISTRYWNKIVFVSVNVIVKEDADFGSAMSESPLLGPTRKSVGCDEERFISPEESRLRVFGRGEATLLSIFFHPPLQRLYALHQLFDKFILVHNV